MPYIVNYHRHLYDPHVDRTFLAPGELNYAITKLCDSYLKSHRLSYSTLNDIIGVLECAKQEFYRRIISPYEDKKIKENGDVF